ncbi:hypothetical protein ACIQZG_07585 [Lysinibacillus sp. NPDC096418]|uniref:hypothetical protein n=1 Tax=Lysinibacillus sp. NPDC096418 TaxID=3364138 RepID=UPI0037FA8417
MTNWKTVLHDVHPTCLNKIDTWAVVLNNWLLMKSHQNNLILSPSKAIHYSINTFLAEELEKFHIFHKIIKMNNDDLFYISAFQFSKAVNLWIYNLLNTDDMDDILHRNIKQEYFLTHSSKDFTTNDAIFHMDQTRVIKKIAQSIRSKNCFRVTVNDAFYQALDIYNTHLNTK